MAYTPPSLFCSVLQVAEPLQLSTPSGIYQLYTTQVYLPDNTPAPAALIDLNSVIELKTVNSQTYGVLHRHYRRSEVVNLAGKVPEQFTHFSQVPASQPYSVALLAFLEQSVLARNPSLLDSFLAHKPGRYSEYYANILKDSFSLQTFDWIADRVKTNAESEAIHNEMFEMQSKMYAEQFKAFPYKDLIGKPVPDETWVYHALATIFGVIIDLVTPGSAEKPITKRFYPNVPSTVCQLIAVTNNAWLYSKASVRAFSSSEAWLELLLTDNLFPDLMQAYTRRTTFARLKNVEEFLRLRSIVADIERTNVRTMAIVESDQSLYDEVFLEVYSQTGKLRSLSELVALRTHCMMRGCSNDAAHFLECDHGICSKCLIQGAILNDLLHCEPCQKVIGNWKMYPPLSTIEKIEAMASMKTRECSQCKVTMKTAAFPLPELYRNRVYQLECAHAICTHCLELCVRDGAGVCPTCEFYVNIHEKEIMAMNCKCVGCDQNKLLIKDFPTVACSDHRFCIECVSKMKRISSCKKCDREFNSEEQSILSMFSALACKRCKIPVRRNQLVQNENKECECILCQKCFMSTQRGSVDILTCLQCSRPQVGESIIVQSYLNVISSIENAEFPKFQEFLTDVETANDKFKACPLCYGPMVFDGRAKVCNGICLHTFHRDCFKDAVEMDITGEIIGRDLKRSPMCPSLKRSGGPCDVEVHGFHLSGALAVIDPEVFDSLGLYAGEQTHKAFTCSKCRKLDYIEKEMTHFECEGCHQDQCVNCKGLWTPTHDEKVCRFNLVQEMIRDRFPENCDCAGAGCGNCTYAQCPGCKLPYLKDDHCNHVVCANPECKVEFCFQCACYRTPILEHCNTWHRRQCPDFPKGDSEKVIQRVIRGEKFKEKCLQCKKLGVRCEPPKNLRRIRRFDIDEE